MLEIETVVRLHSLFAYSILGKNHSDQTGKSSHEASPFEKVGQPTTYN